MKKVQVYFLASLLVLFGLWLSPVLAGAQDGPQQVIQETAGRLQQALKKDRQRLRNNPDYAYRLADRIFLPHVDMHRVSSLALGKHWRKASAAQKRAFSEEFKKLLVRTYATALREMGEWELELLPLRMKPGDKKVQVQSKLIRPGAQPVAMDYTMYRKGGKWLAYDVKIEGISLVTNYRSSFSRLIRQKGIDGLIAELAARNAGKRA